MHYGAPSSVTIYISEVPEKEREKAESLFKGMVLKTSQIRGDIGISSCVKLKSSQIQLRENLLRYIIIKLSKPKEF